MTVTKNRKHFMLPKMKQLNYERSQSHYPVSCLSRAAENKMSLCCNFTYSANDTWCDTGTCLTVLILLIKMSHCLQETKEKNNSLLLLSCPFLGSNFKFHIRRAIELNTNTNFLMLRLFFTNFVQGSSERSQKRVVCAALCA